MQKRSAFHLLSVLAALTVCQAFAQSYPTKPIRAIIPEAPGGVADVVMRATAQELSKRLGQPVVVDSRAGASGIIAAEACAKATPDGYTLCVLNANMASLNPLFFAKLPYDPDKDFEPIVHLIDLTTGIMVASSSPINSVAELRSLAKANPGSLNFGSVGNGSEPHLFLEWLKRLWGTNIVHVPYKGGIPVAQALLSGEIQFTRLGLTSFIGQIRGGKIKLISVWTERSTLFPDVPTLAEVGLGDYAKLGIYPWFGLAGPTGMPKSSISRLNAEIIDIYKDPKFREILINQGSVPATGSAEEFAAFLKSDREHSAELVRITNVRPD